MNQTKLTPKYLLTIVGLLCAWLNLKQMVLPLNSSQYCKINCKENLRRKSAVKKNDFSVNLSVFSITGFSGYAKNWQFSVYEKVSVSYCCLTGFYRHANLPTQFRSPSLYSTHSSSIFHSTSGKYFQFIKFYERLMKECVQFGCPSKLSARNGHIHCYRYGQL